MVDEPELRVLDVRVAVDDPTLEATCPGGRNTSIGGACARGRASAGRVLEVVGREA